MHHAIRRTTGPALALALLLAGAVACSPGHDSPARSGHDAGPAAVAAGGPAAGSAAEDAVVPAASPARFCDVPLPAAWQAAAERGRIPGVPGEDVVPVEVTADGTRVFADVAAAGRRDLVWFRDTGRSRQTVYALPSGAQVFGAGFDGRWLVFGVNPDRTDPTRWELLAWDSESAAAPFPVAHDNGAEGPFLFPRVRAGKAAWVAARPGGGDEVHLYDLAARRDGVVYAGDVSPAFFAGEVLAWREAFGPGAARTIQAVDPAGAHVVLPPQVGAAKGVHDASSDGVTWAWVAADRRTLFAWREGMTEPAAVVTAAPGNVVDGVQVAGDLVTWTDHEATWAADLRTGSFTRLTARYGSADTNGPSVVVSYRADEPVTGTSRATGYTIDATALPPLPPCPPGRPDAVPAAGPDQADATR
ncbi:hypothetical protein [Yinghuangia seranimata]|uniref:hypothetical protein n=1 Tax=Yinghuangia seranimata TaxID=408067 RepID=UPI00248CB4AA|nr:hypothetical protein [Yinghuangia seranimata]MDI2126562.1 hypothetical protein [Yinghuangia seranimata]